MKKYTWKLYSYNVSIPQDEILLHTFWYRYYYRKKWHRVKITCLWWDWFMNKQTIAKRNMKYQFNKSFTKTNF